MQALGFCCFLFLVLSENLGDLIQDLRSWLAMHTVLDSWVLFPGPHHAAVWTLQLLAYLCKDGTQVCLYLLTVALGHSREIITSRRKGCSQKCIIWPAGSQELPWACVLGLLLTSLQLGRPQPSLAIGAGDQ